MFVYIPSHLENIGVIGNTVKLLKAWIQANGFPGSRAAETFDHYYYYFTADPVKNFIRMCLTGTRNTPVDPGILSYLLRLFYSVKGTPAVLDLMESELGLDFQADPETGRKWTYRGGRIGLRLGTIRTFNLEAFVKAQSEFLGALLMYNELKADITESALRVEAELKSDLAVTGWNISNHEVGNS